MSVDWRGVQSLHVIKRDRRIDEEAEQARAHEVPEGHTYKEIDRPAIGTNPANIAFAVARHPHVLPSLETDQHQSHYFQPAEDRAQRQDVFRHTGHVKMTE